MRLCVVRAPSCATRTSGSVWLTVCVYFLCYTLFLQLLLSMENAGSTLAGVLQCTWWVQDVSQVYFIDISFCRPFRFLCTHYPCCRGTSCTTEERLRPVSSFTAAATTPSSRVSSTSIGPVKIVLFSFFVCVKSGTGRSWLTNIVALRGALSKKN